jgi:hypothetical protein
MRIGTSFPPDGVTQSQRTHLVYDVRSGAVIAIYHFAGAASRCEADELATLVKNSHESSGIPIEHLAVLGNAQVPEGRGTLYVEPKTKQLILKHDDSVPHFLA